MFQRDEDKSGSFGYSPFIITGDSPLRATTYGPPSPVGIKYRMRRPQNIQQNSDIQSNIQHRFRGVQINNKHLDLPQNYKINQGSIDHIYKYPHNVQYDTSPYRKYYKKPQELPLVRKTTPRPKSHTFYQEDYTKSNYQDNFSKQTFDDDFNKPQKDFSEEEQQRPFKSESDLDSFSKPFFDNFFNKPQSSGKDSFHDIYYQTATPKPYPKPLPTYAPARNLSKYYKKPLNRFQNKHSSSEYKTQGQIFSEPVDYSRSVYKPSSFTASASSNSGEWTPINAPEGAVPAKSYDIPAPDLSQDRRNSNLKRGIYEDSLRHDVVIGTNKFHKGGSSEFRKGNSEEVVSAVVMVKQ